MEHLVCNIHHWGREPENLFLAGCLSPAVRELRQAGLARRFWFQRFDARGPHLFLLLGAAAGRADELRARLGARMEAWLAAHPSTEPFTDEEIRTRHGQCRGKRLCALDEGDDLVPNNSLRWAPHPTDGYPLRFTAGAAGETEIWELLSDLAAWSVDGLSSSSVAAVRWIAAVDTELRRARPDLADMYWRRHATTLLSSLEARLERGEEAAVLDALPRWVGTRNAAMFGRTWDAVEQESGVCPPLRRLLELGFAYDGRTDAARIALLREVSHSVLGQLGQPVFLHVPLVLYAWMRGRAAVVAGR